MTQSVPFNEVLVTVLGHSLWQATLVSGLVWLAMRLIPARRANWRYAISVAGLSAVVLAALATWSILRLDDSAGAVSMFADSSHSRSTVISPTAAAASADFGEVDPRTGFQDRGRFARRPGGSRSFVQLLAWIWGFGAALMLFRGLAAHVTARTWAANSPSATFDLAPLARLIEEISVRLNLRRAVRLAVSHRTDVPAVVGTLWPVILVPPAMVTGVPIDHWRIILAHELAHVRRWDAVVNLVQMVIESLLFFNPAVWWLSRQVRLEREACCDALAAGICGQPLSVAHVLLDVASSLVGDSSQAALYRQSVALAFAQPANGGELSDRVRRLVDPDRAPHWRLSWISLGTVCLTLIVAVALLQVGTDLAVRAAAQWMSPKERVEKLVQLEAERSGKFIPLAEGPQGEALPDAIPTVAEGAGSAGAGQVAVELVVRTDDGSEIGPQLSLHSLSQAGFHSSGKTLDAPRSTGPEYRTVLSYSPCQLRIGASMPGWATAVTPIVTLMPGDREKSIELILTRGAPVEVAIKNERKEPVPFAWLQQSPQISIRGASTGLSGSDRQADERGRVKLDHVGSADYAFSVQAAGYQRLEFRQAFQNPESFTAAAPFAITLKAARPTPVRVVDAATNRPIAQARLRIVNRQSQASSSNFSFSRRGDAPGRWHDYGITGEDGRLQLDQLQDDASYTFVVLAPGYGAGLLATSAGQAEQTVRLSPPLTISGRVTGAIERLQKQTGPGKSGYRLGIHSQLGEHFSDSVWVDVDPDGQFSQDGFAVGERLMVSLPDERREIVLKQSLADLAFEILPAGSIPTREVIIRLTGTLPGAPARGMLNVSWEHPTVQPDQSQNGPLPLRGNEIRLSVPVGARLNLRERDLVGYRISPQDQVEIQTGADPQIIDVPATPAGGIHGSIMRADGTAADQAFVTVFATRLPRSERDHRRINPDSSSGGSQYLRTVPLGGRYCILAREQVDRGCVWSVSEETTIDENNPIARVDLRLPPGRDLRIKVVDREGRPVKGQRVELEIRFSLKTDSAAGFSFGLKSESDVSGFATFPALSVDQPLGPVELALTAITAAGPYLGTETTIDPRRPVQIQLAPGLSATGILVDVATNRPIPDADIRLIPRQFDQAAFRHAITARTDRQGRFQFDGLEPIEYTGYVEGASPRGTIVEAVGPGLTIRTPAGVQQLSLTADPKAASPVRWEVIIHPNGRLKPLE